MYLYAYTAGIRIYAFMRTYVYIYMCDIHFNVCVLFILIYFTLLGPHSSRLFSKLLEYDNIYDRLTS